MSFISGSPTLLAVVSIVAVFLAVWALVMARDPRRWRLWWMTFLGKLDINNARELKRRQEFRLAIVSYVAFSLLIGVACIGAYLVYVSFQEQKQVRTEYEQARDKTITDLEKIRAKKPFRKL